MPAVTLPSTRSTPSAWPRAGLSVLRLWLRRARARNVLAALHPDQIRDAGLDPYRLRDESLKPFWRA